MIFFFKQKTAYEIKECDWSSDVCSSDLKIITMSHTLNPKDRWHNTNQQDIIIEKNVWIATGCMILKSVGMNSVIGAYSVVTKSEIGRASCRERV